LSGGAKLAALSGECAKRNYSGNKAPGKKVSSLTARSKSLAIFHGRTLLILARLVFVVAAAESN
jgi:hypothetical protein